MKGQPYSYDRDLYGRAFLNCFQRQSLVMLAPAVPELPHVFGACLISTDDIVEQVVRRRRPKYDFESAFFEPDNLRQVGVVRHDEPFDDFTAVRPAVLDAVGGQGFALLVVDVYYLPHCPEYRGQHVVHTVVVTGHDEDTGEWTIIDDNPASVLCVYTYPEDIIAAAYDNGVLRRLRTFSVTEAAPDTVGEFLKRVAGYTDSRVLFERAHEIVADPWLAPDLGIAALHDAFSLYQGSRVCLRAYLNHVAGAEVASAVDDAVAKASAVLNVLLIAKVTGAVDPAGLRTACAEVGAADELLMSHLRTLDAAR